MSEAKLPESVGSKQKPGEWMAMHEIWKMSTIGYFGPLKIISHRAHNGK
jgi:hypothetical protein